MDRRKYLMNCNPFEIFKRAGVKLRMKTEFRIENDEDGYEILITPPVLAGEPEEKWLRYDIYEKIKKQKLPEKLRGKQ